jgi:hypothetical protein
MSEREILSAVFPAHADLQPILKQLREKYGLPDLGRLDKNLVELLLPQQDIPWDAIKRDIRSEVETHSEIFPDQIQRIRQYVQKHQAALDDPEKFVETTPVTEEDIKAARLGTFNLIKPMAQAYSRVVDDICNLMFVYLATGETEEIPLDWLGAVYTSSMFGEPIVVAMAGQLSNPDEIIARFTAEIHRVFGKERPKITAEFRNMAKYLRKRLEGISVPSLVNLYIEAHPDEFNKDRKSQAFRDQKYRKNDALKKSLARYKAKLLELIGDNSKT